MMVGWRGVCVREVVWRQVANSILVGLRVVGFELVFVFVFGFGLTRYCWVDGFAGLLIWLNGKSAFIVHRGQRHSDRVSGRQ
jgi:hypothetical protein